ncbi:hypothetical protein GCM10009539_03970 [Cryptosporangium japonicum]|uniref:Uncharacterized protein n=1 Tax=Cryptosporangium japonicum TaxID=80872 RepID=A0ABN0THT5_9ACTN
MDRRIEQHGVHPAIPDDIDEADELAGSTGNHPEKTVFSQARVPRLVVAVVVHAES